MADVKEKYNHGEYGYMPLSKLVDLFCVRSFNNDRKYYDNLIIIAASVWKKIKFQELRSVKRKWVTVSHDKMFVDYPVDCLRVVGAEYLDECNHLQPMFHDDQYNTMPYTAPKCTCKKCNCNSEACGAINMISETEEDVVLGGHTYKKIIKSRVCANGDIIRETTEPFGVQTADGNSIVWRTNTEIVEKVNVKPCGCIDPAPDNVEKCFKVCGYPQGYCHKECPDVFPNVSFSDRPTYKIDNDRREVHFINCRHKKAVLIYVSNGEDCAKDILIPEYAEDCVMAGLYFESLRFRSTVGRLEKNQAKVDYTDEKQQLIEFLYPIVPHEFFELQNNFPKW